MGFFFGGGGGARRGRGLRVETDGKASIRFHHPGAQSGAPSVSAYTPVRQKHLEADLAEEAYRTSRSQHSFARTCSYSAKCPIFPASRALDRNPGLCCTVDFWSSLNLSSSVVFPTFFLCSFLFLSKSISSLCIFYSCCLHYSSKRFCRSKFFPSTVLHVVCCACLKLLINHTCMRKSNYVHSLTLKSLATYSTGLRQNNFLAISGLLEIRSSSRNTSHRI